MSYEIQVIKHGETVEGDRVVYFQHFYNINIDRLVRELNNAYWTDVEPPEEEEPDKEKEVA